MAHLVKCKFCGQTFDRDVYLFCKPSSTRYAHPECCKKNGLDLEIYDPTAETSCCFCKKIVNKNKDGIEVRKGVWAHKACYEYDCTREKTDKEKLHEYVMNLFNYEYLPPALIKQLDGFVTKYNFTYSGMLGTLTYFYEVEHADKSKAHGMCSIIPYIYEKAKSYYFRLNQVQKANENIILEKPKEKVLEVIPKERTARENKRHKFLMEE